MVLPNFLGVGVQRAATTWLYDCLSEHPQVCLAKVKEVNFFNHYFDKGLSWYEDQFSGYAGHKAVGEITPLYLHTAPLERIASTLPQARLVVILREPIDRAYSSYQLLQESLFPGLNFEQAIATPRGKAILGYSMYAERLGALFELYPREQVLVELYDDVGLAPAELFSRVCAHIGVDRHFMPSRLKVISNRIIMPQFQRTLRNLHLGGALEMLKRTRLGQSLKQLSKRRQVIVDRSSEMKSIRQRLSDVFRQDILQCQKMLDRDLSGWLSRN